MDYILEGFINGIKLLFSFDKEVMGIVLVSLKTSTIAALTASLIGIPFGFVVAIKEFYGRRIIITLLNTLLSLPTVLIGLLLYSLISRRGLLGELSILFTQGAIIIGQIILAFPIISAMTLSAVQGVDSRVSKTAVTLGASRMQVVYCILHEGSFAILAAVIAGFGRVFSEVGVSMMLGGNIKGYTRNITTAIAFETGKGEFAMGIALGMVLLAVALIINIIFHFRIFSAVLKTSSTVMAFMQDKSLQSGNDSSLRQGLQFFFFQINL